GRCSPVTWPRPPWPPAWARPSRPRCSGSGSAPGRWPGPAEPEPGTGPAPGRHRAGTGPAPARRGPRARGPLVGMMVPVTETPYLRVVRGEPTAEELAALVAVLAAR